MILEVVFLLEVPITKFAVVMVIGLHVVLPQSVIVLEYSVAIFAVAVVLFQVVIELILVIKEFIAWGTIIVLGALSPVLL